MEIGQLLPGQLLATAFGFSCCCCDEYVGLNDYSELAFDMGFDVEGELAGLEFSSSLRRRLREMTFS